MSLSQPVSAIMTLKPVVATQFHNFSQVLRLITEFPVHHLPIVDGNNKLIGIISSNDLPKVFLNLSKRDEKVALDLDVIDAAINLADIMTPNPVTISSSDTIETAAKIFGDAKFLALPVVDNGELVGILSIKDVMSYMAQ